MWLTTRDKFPLDPFFMDFWEDGDEKGIKNFSPAANIIEKKNAYEIDVLVPGLKKEDLNVDIKNNMLTVSGERKKEHKEEKEGYYHYESSFGKFSRSWELDGVMADRIKADYRDGVLKIYVPKKEETSNKSVKVT